MDRVKGKTAIVTGASLGIGRATAILLAKEGAKVALTDLRDAEGKKSRQRDSGRRRHRGILASRCRARAGSAKRLRGNWRALRPH